MFRNRYGCDSIVPVDLAVTLPEPEIAIEVDTLSTTRTCNAYQWMKNGSIIPGATGAQYTVRENAHYQVIVTDENGCTDISDVYPVSNHSIIKDVPAWEEQIYIYPNPAQDILWINSPVTINAIITGVDGRRIVEISRVKHISISKFAEGIYFLEIRNVEGKVVKTEKFIKQ